MNTGDSGSSLARHTVALGGLFAGTVLMLSAPGAGIAQAHEGNRTESGQAVGRDGLDNPAPAVRLTQAVGDHVYNDKTALNRALNESTAGQNYHRLYGTPNYDDYIHGSNGTQVGLLNKPGYRELYDGLQDAGVDLPGEADLPGTLVRRVSGVSPDTGHGHGHGDESDNDEADAGDDSMHAMAVTGDCVGSSKIQTGSVVSVSCDTRSR